MSCVRKLVKMSRKATGISDSMCSQAGEERLFHRFREIPKLVVDTVSSDVLLLLAWHGVLARLDI